MKWTECAAHGPLCYSISNEALGAVTWVASVLTLIGLGVAIFQSKKARSAAEATSQAVSSLQIHVDGVNLAYLSAQMNTVMHLVRKNDYEMAHILFAPIKRSLRLFANSKGLDLTATESLRRTIGKIDVQLEWGRTSHQKFSLISTNRHLDDLLSQLTQWESLTSNSRRQEIENENP